MLLFQAGTFMLPFNAWKHMEGGLIKVCLDYNWKKKPAASRGQGACGDTSAYYFTALVTAKNT
jgi:hypothetical protein